MAIQVVCSACGRKLNAPDASAGSRGKCPACGEVLEIPAQPSVFVGDHATELRQHPVAAETRHRTTDALSFHGSRWGQVFGGRITDIVFPPIFTLRSDCIETKRVGVFFLPWTSEVERMPFGKVASYRHLKGLFWDNVVVETAGGSKDLRIRGLRKADAEQLTGALDARLAIAGPAQMRG